MTLKKTSATAGAAALAALVASSPAFATNGYFTNGYSPESKGMAGAGAAIGTGVTGLAQNPAMGTRYPNQWGACLGLFAPDRSITVDPGGPLTPGTHKSENPLFAIPCGAVNFQLNETTTLGVVAYGNGGMNTEYKTNFFSGLGAGSSPLGVNLEQLFIAVNFAHDVTEDLSIGVAPILAVQRFRATGLEAFGGLSMDPAHVTNNGDNWSTGFGVSLGFAWQASPELTFGGSYRSKINMSEFDDYAGLFAGGGDFDIPATATLGLAYSPKSNPGLTLTAEYQRIWYGSIPAIANTSAPPGGPLGAASGAGFGWKDMDVIRVGAQMDVNDKWTVRGGLSYATEFTDAPEAVINTLAPATPQWHAAIGATYHLDERREISMSYVRAFNNELTGSNPAFTGVAQPVTLRMDQHEFTVGMTWKF